MSERRFSELQQRFRSLPAVRGRIAAFEFVRDIPYGDIGSRNPLDVLEAGQGTCSGKHALLRMFLEGMGYEVRSWFARHDFGQFPIHPWPDALAVFKGKIIPDFHDFLKMRVMEEWVTVDAVFDAPLVVLGFPMLRWDGQNSMSLPIHYSEVFPAEEDVEDHKRRLIAELPREIQELRRHFLSRLTVWLKKERLRSE
jgi:hypothetical protein